MKFESRKIKMLAWQHSQKKWVDGDVAFDIMSSYMLREIELMTLVGVIYIGYIDNMNFTCILFFIRAQQKSIN